MTSKYVTQNRHIQIEIIQILFIQIEMLISSEKSQK